MIKLATGPNGAVAAGIVDVSLVSLTPDAIVAFTLPVALALKQVTTTIPIVISGGGDPVTGGLVSNLARPGGNITGFTVTEPSLGGKWLELLKELRT
jgi:putative ABC transport system substrate-binding protein